MRSDIPDYVCPTCGFELWHPIGTLSVSYLGFYSDSRFPGRCLLVLRDHYESWESLPPDLLHEFVDDSQKAIRTIENVTGSRRVNIAVLGNAEPHVHFHLIPRYPRIEPLPNKAPWEDPRPRSQLASEENERLVSKLRIALHKDPDERGGSG